MVMDRTDPRPRARDPAGIGPAVGHGFDDDRLRRPVKPEAGMTAADEEIVVATTEKIETQVEGRLAKSREHRPPDQTIAAAIDHRDRSAGVIAWTKRRMAVQSMLHVVVEIRKHRPADDIGAGRLGGAHHRFEPVL